MPGPSQFLPQKCTQHQGGEAELIVRKSPVKPLGLEAEAEPGCGAGQLAGSEGHGA